MKLPVFIATGLIISMTACERQITRVQLPEPASTPPAAATPLMTSGPTPNPVNWDQRAKEVHVGMRRAEVERLLPSYSRPLAAGEDFRRFSTLTTGTGGGQGVRYHVSEDVVAIVHYDYTGVPRDASGTATGFYSPDNLVTAPVQIDRTK